MASFYLKKWVKLFKGLKKIPLLIFSLLMSSSAFASSSSSLPFATNLQKLADAIRGPWLLAVSIIMIVTTCCMLAFGEHGDGFRRIITIVMWLSIAFAVTNFITTMFGGGALF